MTAVTQYEKKSTHDGDDGKLTWIDQKEGERYKCFFHMSRRYEFEQDRTAICNISLDHHHRPRSYGRCNARNQGHDFFYLTTHIQSCCLIKITFLMQKKMYASVIICGE